MEKEISKFTKISKERIRKTTSAEIAREIGQVERVNSENESGDEIEKINPSNVKEKVFGEAESNQSINQFEEEVLKKNMQIKGTDRKLNIRKKIVSFLKKIMTGKSSDDYKKMKDDTIRKAS